jgi:hypothetical protein
VALLHGCDGGVRLLGPARREIRQGAARAVNQQQPDALALQTVVMVKPVSINCGLAGVNYPGRA